jgi:hypothetical protein
MCLLVVGNRSFGIVLRGQKIMGDFQTEDLAQWCNGRVMAEWSNNGGIDGNGGMAGMAGMKDGIMNVGMSERTAQWLNGRNGNQNIIKL